MLLGDLHESNTPHIYHLAMEQNDFLTGNDND